VESKYSDDIVTYSNDAGKGKYIGVEWAPNQRERCSVYVLRIKWEFQERPWPCNESQYEEVRCRRKKGHKGACLNNRKYPG
jgi:hypothetical protein